MDRDGKMGVHLDVPINGFAGRLSDVNPVAYIAATLNP
jgi:hypothetical protein